MEAPWWILSFFCITFIKGEGVNNTFQEVNGTLFGNQTFSLADGPYLVTSDLVISQNVTLIVEAGTEVLLIPKVGIRVYGSLLARGIDSQRITFRSIPCNGTSFCNSTNPTDYYNPGIRLVDGTSYNNGRLEVEWNGQWGTICDRYWDQKDTEVACRQLGYLGAKRYYRHPGSGSIWLRNVGCRGSEKSIWRCSYYGRIGYTGCSHYQDVGIECDTLLPFLKNNVYWKGIFFTPSNTSGSPSRLVLDNVDIVNAFEGIKALRRGPELIKVAVKDGAYGLVVDYLQDPLKIVDSRIVRCKFAGINITSNGSPVLIQNVTVLNTSFGDGLIMKQIMNSMDFCSSNIEQIRLPLVLNASGKTYCRKIFRATPGRTISAHFRVIEGSEFEVNVTDGSTPDKTLLSKITSDHNRKMSKTASSSVLEISFFSKGSARVPVRLEIVIMSDGDPPPLLLISNSSFCHNTKSGITANGVVGQTMISSTTVMGNGVGLHINQTHGEVKISSTTVLENGKDGINMGNITGSVNLKTVNSSENQGSGIVIAKGAISLAISDCRAIGNTGRGLYISHQLNSTINISSLNVSKNSWSGVYLKDFSERSKISLTKISSSVNSQHGALLERVTATSLNILASTFDGNSIHGMKSDKVIADNIFLRGVSTSNNYNSGIFINYGKSNVTVESWSSVGNDKDGLYLYGLEGELSLRSCFIEANKQSGLAVYDSHVTRIDSFHMQNCSVLGNNEYGVRIKVYSNVQTKNDNYSISVRDSTIANNTNGGVYIYCRCSYSSYALRRHVRFSCTGNKVYGNQKFGLNLQAPEEYELNAFLSNNVFENNIGDTLSMTHSCRNSHLPVKIAILSNTFKKNRGERVIFVDHYSLPERRLAIIKNNTFLENQKNPSLSQRYLRLKTQAVVVLKEGTFTVEGNSFDNPSFPNDIATFLRDEERLVNATGNWWGSNDECKIKRRIFDFEDRVDLARILYYPFLDSTNLDSPSHHNGVRPFCFLDGNKLGGVLDRAATLYKSIGRYEVTGDVIVLSNGTLTIEGNVTLEFPQQAVFFVQGQILIEGKEVEKVKFIPKNLFQKEVRLVDGVGPWEGRLEIWFNYTWTSVCVYRNNYVSGTACRQLGYEGYTTSFRRASKQETNFIYDIQCSSNENDNIMSCNRDKWSSKTACSSYVLYVHCRIPYWAGVHLTITAKKSVIDNLDINYAGFSYRDDLPISGSALRVDHTHHEIRGVHINNSAQVGLHVVYSHPFKRNTSDILNSTVMNTILDGIRVESPYAKFTKTNVIKTKGRGFYYRGAGWRAINIQAMKLADPKVKKYINLCSENGTLLSDHSQQYYLIASAEKIRSCESVINVVPGYRIGMELISRSLASTFQVYSGTNTTSSIPWEINRLESYDRPLWLSNSSTVLLRSSSYYSNYASEVQFLLYLVKASDDIELDPLGIVISQSSFIRNAQSAIYIYNPTTRLGDVYIQRSSVCESAAVGIEMYNSRVRKLNIFNCSLVTNRIGISLYSFSGDMVIKHSEIVNSTSTGLSVDSGGRKTLQLINSNVTHSKGAGMAVYDRYANTKLLVTGSFFGWNERETFVTHSAGSLVSFEQSTFLHNSGPVVYFGKRSRPQMVVFQGNVLTDNTGSSLLEISSYYSSEIFIRKNLFSLNFCLEKGVIDISGSMSADKLIIGGNLFEGNTGRSVFVEGSSYSPVIMTLNVFKYNNCSSNGVVEIRRMEKDVEITDNVFSHNKGLFVVLLQCVYNIRFGMIKQNFTFTNNSLENNTKVPSNTFACEVNISGLLENKTISLHENKFYSDSFSKELCVNILATSHTSILDASLNFWGYDSNVDVRKRIFDAGLDHELVSVVTDPFRSSRGIVIHCKNQTADNPLRNVLGGHISSLVRLRSDQVPYIVLSDIIVLPDASLIVEPGVEVQLGPSVSMLILGSLRVLGTADHPVRFSVLKKNQAQKPKLVRLSGGKYPWTGRLEVTYNGSWTPVCLSKNGLWELKNAIVVCKQLGYESPLLGGQTILRDIQLLNASAWPFNLNCFGNETEISECPLSSEDRWCNSSQHVILSCRGGLPWGNIRFAREFGSAMYPSSVLNHLEIKHCGLKHGREVAAIEAIQYVPEMNSVNVLNCTSGGLKVLFPENQTKVEKSSFVNTGRDGVEILAAKHMVTLGSIKSSNNKHGVTFHNPDETNMQGIWYGQIMLCALGSVINFTRDELFLYFKGPPISKVNPTVSCQKVIQAGSGYSLSFKLLSLKKYQVIRLYDPFGRVIVASYNQEERRRLKDQVVFPWDRATVLLSGHYDGDVLLRVKRIRMKEIPCTFEQYQLTCGWEDYSSSTLLGNALDRKWFINSREMRYYNSAGTDHTFASYKGRYIFHGNRYGSGYAALVSPPILEWNSTCRLVFYYKLWKTGRASLSVLIEEFHNNATTNNSVTKILWTTNYTMNSWKKQMIELPQSYANFSVIFLGYYESTYYYRSFVAMDDVELVDCNTTREKTVIMHRITGSTISGNLGHGISCKSTETSNHVLKIERSKITNNGMSSEPSRKPFEAIHLNTTNLVFQITNSFVAGNRNGGIYVGLRNDDHLFPSARESYIHGNTIENNRGSALLLDGTSGVTSNVKVTRNYFSFNLGTDWQGNVDSVCKLTDVTTIFQGNVLYNNSGKYIVEFANIRTSLTFMNNTLSKNIGLGVNYGVTVLLNGFAQMHNNVFHNPYNRYQIITTLQGSPVTVDARNNWWGVSVPRLIESFFMDKTKDYRLSLTVAFKPFLNLPPRKVLSVSCPPGWMTKDGLCYLNKGASLTFQEAEEYCENNGGFIISMVTPENRKLIQFLRDQDSHFGWTGQVPALWTSKAFAEAHILEKGTICFTTDSSGEIQRSPCDNLHPFVCVRRPVIHCPNACFHNGDCVGAVCFCHRGWTAEDCSRFHCNDLHACSGRGECVGPNVCKCYPGFLGRGCTYSYCGKYESCGDCVKDPYCGWCDSIQSCLGGFGEGAPGINCPDWFFYHCYTVGRERHCSNNIQRVDCKGKHCNYQDGRPTTESCQKCKDLEKCFKFTEGSRCRAWNETRCPGGKVQVDYTDLRRSNNVELAKNVKLVEPNTTTIYACPVMIDEQQEMSLFFVAPKVVDVKEGDILCSPQAGGIMHKISNVVDNGPFKIMMSAPAGLEEVINYADFKQEATLESVEDESTLEDEPDEQDLQDLIAGNITLNASRTIILTPGSTIFKCLGHTYEVDNVIVHSYYLVMDKIATTPNTSDILVSNATDGFIEMVVADSQVDHTEYLETKLHRCNEDSRFNMTRLKQSKRQLHEASFCSGGDNNPGLIVSTAEGNAKMFSLNDSIVGRPSQGFVAKAVKVHSNTDFLLVEVISAEFDVNGTVSTSVEIHRLQSHHRRTKRSNSLSADLTNFEGKSGRMRLVSERGSAVEGQVSASLRLTVSIEIEKKWYSWEVIDSYVGLELEGRIDFTVDLRIVGGLSFSGRVNPMRRRQLGGNKNIRLGLILIPTGIFLELTGNAHFAVKGVLRHSISAGGNVALGGKCRLSEGCHSTSDTASLYTHWDRSETRVEAGARIQLTVTPRISIKVPVAPKWLGRLMKTSFFSPLKKLFGKAGKYVDLSLSIYVNAPLTVGMSVNYPSDDCQVSTPAEFTGYFGLSDLVCGVNIGFVGKHFDLHFRTGYSRVKTSSYCICPVPRDKFCVGPTSPPTEQPSKKPDKDDYKRPIKKSKGNKGSGHRGGHRGSSVIKTPRPPCGKEPCCAGNRKGPRCSQPDFWPSRGTTCSGNGLPQSTATCGAACRCLGGWGGPFCDSASASGGGDPHLETLDGVEYDFFGIGEFWGCKSPYNDFGLQFRFFYYKRASLIGGAAIKAGRSIVTVMTIKANSSQEQPIIRLDGISFLFATNATRAVEINNGTVLLDRQVRFTSEANENSVVLISLQYNTGLTITIDVRHSRVMKRQYLNVFYSPTAAYKGHTEGLCGFMDNNATNDFMGSDGKLYQDAIQFAESWRIKDCHNGSGTRDSWSWNSSNFYHKDLLDLSYTDPSFQPIYTLHGISQSVIELATNTCKSLGISDNDLQSCIYDVAITNDTTFTDQEGFKQGCPNQCSGKGRCLNGSCRCLEGWSGNNCDKGTCSNCSSLNGKCVKGFCECAVGWEGKDCDNKATCYNANNCTSPVHGICKTTDICQCHPGYLGPDCSIVPTCHKVSNCSGKGLCVDFNVCKCDKGWTGKQCTQYSCEHLDHCSGRGRCVGLYQCACDDGWTGASCALPDCRTVNQCSGKGVCVSSNTCRCYPGFIGANCSDIANCSELSNCSGRGICVFTEAEKTSCRCFEGFTGPNCSQAICTTLNNCSGHGQCIDGRLCKCDLGFNGTNCSNYSCETLNFCSGNGVCTGYDLCNCNSSWSGPACNVPDCSAVNNCSGQGVCILPNACVCYPSFDGKFCDQKADRNINTPKFDRPLYNATMPENAPVGSLVLQLHANDSDKGRNGHVFYSMADDKGVGNIFTVDGKTGKIYNLLKLDFQTLKESSFNITIIASDDGIPQRSTSTVVQITIIDVNDNCPTFTQLGLERIEISAEVNLGAVVAKVSATDLDSGTNSEITFAISRNDAFSVDPKSGIVTVISTPTRAMYDLIVTAEDNGSPPCKTKTVLTVFIRELPTGHITTHPTEAASSKTTPTTTEDTVLETQSYSSEITGPIANSATSGDFKSTTQLASSVVPTEHNAVPQKTRKYIVIGLSALGGILVLLIVVLIIRKLLCRRKVNPGLTVEPLGMAVGKDGRINDAFELSAMTKQL